MFLCLLIYKTSLLSHDSLLFGVQPNELLVAIVNLMTNVLTFRNGERRPVIKVIKGISQGYICSLTGKCLLFSLLFQICVCFSFICKEKIESSFVILFSIFPGLYCFIWCQHLRNYQSNLSIKINIFCRKLKPNMNGAFLPYFPFSPMQVLGATGSRYHKTLIWQNFSSFVCTHTRLDPHEHHVRSRGTECS